MRALRATTWVVAALLLGAGLGGSLLCEAPLGNLEGYLEARDSGHPVAAEVTLRGPRCLEARTGTDGEFRLKGIPVGVYLFSASSPGHVVEDRVVCVNEGRTGWVKLEMERRASWLELVVHHDILYPGEPTSIAVRGLTLKPSYSLAVYRVDKWRTVAEEEACVHPKALEAAVRRGEVGLVSSRDVRPGSIDWEGVFYDRTDLGELAVGRYLVVARGETGTYSAGALTISRLGLLVKTDREKALAYVTDLKTGQPIAGVRVRGPAGSGTTDEEGLAIVPRRGAWGNRATYRAELGEDRISLDTWQDTGAGEGYRLFCFTDRPLYRPGDEVGFKGVLRKRVGVGYALPGRVKVEVTVTDQDGMEIHKASLITNDQGSAAGSFVIPKEGRAGYYTLRSRGEGFDYSVPVKVASYLKPEVQLEARPKKVQYVRGELAQVSIQANYYFGAPAGGLDLAWALTRDIYYPGAEAEEYGDGPEYEEGYYGGGGELVAEGKGSTDESGRLRLTLPTRLMSGEQASEESPYHDHRFTLSVWSTSEAGGAAETTASYLVTRGDFLLIVRPESYVLTPGNAAGIKIEARDFRGRPVRAVPLSLSLLKENRPKVSGEVTHKTLSTWQAVTGSDGVAETTVTAPTTGEFVLEVRARDAEGRAIAEREYLWAAGGLEWAAGEWERGISIICDRKEYGPHDKAKVLVTSEHAGPALLCLEGELLHEFRAVTLRRGANLLEIALRPELLPEVQVWVGQVYDKRLHRGQTSIRISRDIHRLRVTILAGRAQYEPGESATCRVQVADAEGRPTQAELAVGVVDEAIYALARDDVPDPAEFFYYPQWNHVNTAFAPESYYLGGGDKAPPNIEVRRRFRDTAFWAPVVMTDAEGRAEVAFTLPDNLTSWRVTARAVSSETKGGAGRASFAVSKPLMVRLDLPRFATQGDRFRVSAYVHNETAEQRRVALAPWARGMELEGRKEEISIPPRRVVRTDWWATVTSAEGVTIGASAVSGKLRDAVEVQLPVNPFTQTQFDAWSGQTEGEAEVAFALREDAPRDRTRLTVAVSPSVAASLFSSVEYLVRYPYGCVEQTISSFLPGLYVEQLLEARGLGDLPLARDGPQRVREGLARLAKLEREEGGWGWGRWGELDIWMTSYALLALLETQRAGYQIAGIERGLWSLETALRSPRDEYEYPDDVAFTAYVLARLKSDLARPTLVRALRDRKLSGRGRALCALAFFELGDAAHAHQLVEELWGTAKEEGQWLNWTGLQSTDSEWWDGGANVEATAWALKAALRADAPDPRAARVAGWLLQSRRGDHWVSTRDTAIALSALVDYLRVLAEPNPSYTAVVEVNGVPVFERVFGPDPRGWGECEFEVPASGLRKGANTVAFLRDGRQGRLYYRVNLRQQVPMDERERTARGDVFQIQREYFKLARGKSGDVLAFGPATRTSEVFDSGDGVLVRLTFSSRQRLRYVVIEDPLPAGLEPSARGEVGFMDWRSWWVDSDVRDDKVIFYLDWLPAGERTIEYVATARTSGRFNALPTSGFAMYQPKINALGEKALLEVKP